MSESLIADQTESADVKESTAESEISPNEVSLNDSPINPCFNPSLPSEIQPEDIVKIKGDAIGDTLYSERYVLSILLKLAPNQNELSEEFEKDLCTLWDMTIEKDVVKLLLIEHDVLDLFCIVIQTTENARLLEILVGIIGNMCCFPETRNVICYKNELMSTILNLIDSDDALTLIQLMRFIRSALVFDNSGDEIVWLYHFSCVENFIEKVAFILENSTSATLLLLCYEALNAMLNKFSVLEAHTDKRKENLYRETFIKPCLVFGIIEAFKQMLPDLYNPDQSLDAVGSSPSEKHQKIMNYFLEINVLLSQYESVSFKMYESFLSDLFDCISRILEPLCNPINLFPLSSSTQDIIENVNEIFQSLGDPFNAKCFAKLTKIWSEIRNYQMERENRDESDEVGEGAWDSIDDINTEDICMTILEYITRVNKNSHQLDVNSAIKLIGRGITESLLHDISVGDSEPDIDECCKKLRAAIKENWSS